MSYQPWQWNANGEDNHQCLLPLLCSCHGQLQEMAIKYRNGEENRLKQQIHYIADFKSKLLIYSHKLTSTMGVTALSLK